MKETTMQGDGMMAIFDDAGVEKQIKRRDGVVRVDANLLSGAATTVYDETRASRRMTSEHLSPNCPGKAMPFVEPSFRYVWLIWASVFLLPWTVLFVAWRALRRPMLWVSALTAVFGLTEPLFVPGYWNPPSLFDLTHRTGFDIENLIFCFAIGGLAAAGYRGTGAAGLGTCACTSSSQFPAASLTPWHLRARSSYLVRC